ncbi:hypothetical protein [Paenibacillus daejeonensis]|uniref:hypothetical protein n=1 Tax=Paenibacillus daejeonensis TaxID=135193 RepID=UPI0003713EB2|nr:hypothetical protein [Paenibacillus daejeonensis]
MTNMDTAAVSLGWFGRLVAKFKVQKTNQTLWVYCPGCGKDLCSNGSLVKDEEFVEYKCTNCSRESRWDFDRYGPAVVEVDERGWPKGSVPTESTQAKPEAVSGLGEDNHPDTPEGRTET